MDNTNTFLANSSIPEEQSTSGYKTKYLASLFVTDTLLYIFICQLSLPLATYFGEQMPLNFTSAGIMLKLCLCVSAIRLFFCHPIQIMAFIWLAKKLKAQQKVLLTALLNSGLFVLIVLFYAFVLFSNSRRDHLTKPLFYFLVLATYLSPIILNKIASFRNKQA